MSPITHVYHLPAVRILNVERETVRRFAHVSKVISELLLTADPNVFKILTVRQTAAVLIRNAKIHVLVHVESTQFVWWSIIKEFVNVNHNILAILSRNVLRLLVSQICFESPALVYV